MGTTCVMFLVANFRVIEAVVYSEVILLLKILNHYFEEIQSKIENKKWLRMLWDKCS